MLSFLRDGDGGKPAVTHGENRSEAAAQSKEQLNEKMKEPTLDEPREYLTVANKLRNVRRNTILLGVLFVAGLFGLLIMIKKSTPQTVLAETSSVEEAEIEEAIARLTGIRSQMLGRMDEIVKKFYEFSDVQQVNVNELVKNPFELENFLNSANCKKAAGNSESDTEMIRQQWLREQSKGMQLLSIMNAGGDRCCMIDDNILYVGDSIKGFEVHEISDSFVRLGSAGVEITLKLTE